MDQHEVQIHGITYNAMCRILDFIYTSELELGVHNVQETLAAACQLQVPPINILSELSLSLKIKFIYRYFL